MRPISGRPWLDCTPSATPLNLDRAAKINRVVCNHVSDIITCEELKRGTSFLRYAVIMGITNATQSKFAAYYAKRGASKGAILPFQMNMFSESFVHTLRGRLPKGLALAFAASLNNYPRWDPRYLAGAEDQMIKSRTFYICQRRSGKSTTAVSLIAAKMITHPGDSPGYYCNDDTLSGKFGSMVKARADSIIENRALQTQLVMLYRCESLRNVKINGVNKYKEITVTFGPDILPSTLMCKSASKGDRNLRGHTHTTVIMDELFTMKDAALNALLPHATLDTVKQFGICSPMPGAVTRICHMRNVLQYKPDSEYNLFIFTINCHLKEHRRFLEIGCPCPCGKFYAPDHVSQNSSTDKDITDILTGKTSFFFDERGIASASSTEDEHEKAAIGEIVVDEANLRMSLDRNKSLAKWIPHFKSHSAGAIIPPYNCIFHSTYINSLYFVEMSLPRVPELNVQDCYVYVDPALGSDNWQCTSAIGVACVGLDHTRPGKHMVLLAGEHKAVIASMLGRVHKVIAGLVVNMIERIERKRNVQYEHLCRVWNSKRKRSAGAGASHHPHPPPFVKARYRIICEKNSSVNAVHQVVKSLQGFFNIHSELANRILIYHSDGGGGSSSSSGSGGSGGSDYFGDTGVRRSSSLMTIGGKRMRLHDGSSRACLSSSSSTSAVSSPDDITPIGYVLGKTKKPMFFKLADDLANGYSDLTMGLMTTSNSFEFARAHYEETITTICAKFLSMMTLNEKGSVSGKCATTTRGGSCGEGSGGGGGGGGGSGGDNGSSTMGIRYEHDDFTVALVMSMHFACNPPEATMYRSLMSLMIYK